ncbi:MAG TPA: DUF1800 family protein [Ilumatobacteraceae bacterium]|nr:DUF1800 family protein [Ilumatobacteraceae bacterium]
MAEPALTEENVRHLLRRTEFVDRQTRVDALMGLGSIAAAVDDVLIGEPVVPSVTFSASGDWQRGVELGNHWFDQMAHDAERPFSERMALFWHGHFCSDLGKVGSAVLMREQIDLWRREGLGNVRSLARTMSTQVAMIRYLDNNQNRATSPNQNFARELMELFLLGVGNYTEADVEASTAAWTGHSDQWNDEVSPYRWRPEWHDFSPKQYLGRTINTGLDGRDHGPETIDVVLGNGIVPAGATNVANRGRPTRDVAAEFLSRKLWTWFATDGPPPARVLSTMAEALVAGDFAVRPWVRSMLTHEDFYTDQVKAGLVRTPVEFAVALMYATGKRAAEVNFWWLMDSMGQRLLYPPNVSGWRPNGYWVNASAMEGRARAAQHFFWNATRTYWQSGGAGVISLAHGQLTNQEVIANQAGVPTMSNATFIQRLEQYTGIRLADPSRAEILRYADGASVWERNDALLLVLLAPEMHVA